MWMQRQKRWSCSCQTFFKAQKIQLPANPDKVCADKMMADLFFHRLVLIFLLSQSDMDDMTEWNHRKWLSAVNSRCMTSTPHTSPCFFEDFKGNISSSASPSVFSSSFLFLYFSPSVLSLKPFVPVIVSSINPHILHPSVPLTSRAAAVGSSALRNTKEVLTPSAHFLYKSEKTKICQLG